MKVLQVNAVNAILSTGRSVSELGRGLERRGIASRVVYSVGPPPENGHRIGNPLDHKLHALSSRLTGKQGYFSRGATRRLLHYVDAETPDIVHLRNLHANYINLPMFLEFLAERDIATVITLDDCWWFTGHCSHYTMDGCHRWLDGCGQCPRLKKDNPSWLLDRTRTMWADKRRLLARIPRLAVIGVSDWITGEAERSFLSNASIIRRIYNWVDLDVLQPVPIQEARRRTGLPSDAKIALGVASEWTDDKGLSDFSQLAERMSCAVGNGKSSSTGAAPAGHLSVVLVGKITGRAATSEHVSLVGVTHDLEQLADYYSAADVFLQLSPEETFGKVTAEALACGTPAVVYDSTANPELVGPGCGYVAAPRNLSEVMQFIETVVSDGKNSYTEHCRRFAQMHFDKETLIDEHVSLYQELLAVDQGLTR